jgi:anti-sigma factor RsiW
MTNDDKPECTFKVRAQALHDDALSPAEREPVAAHAAACPACSAELARLTRLSALLALAKPAEMNVFGLARVKARVVSARLRQIAQEQRWRVVRVGEWLTAAAAAIMVACGMALYASEIPSQPTRQTAQVSDEILQLPVERPGDVSFQSEQEKALLLAVSMKGEQP